MRWYWIDRFTQFESGRRATAIKCVTFAEIHLSDHFPGAPSMPPSLAIEGIAQTGGLLVGQTSNFELPVVLAKLSRAKFHFRAVPGDTIRYTTVIEELQNEGAIVSATGHVDDRLYVEAQCMFAHLPGHRELFRPVAFLALLRTLDMFKVAVNSDGTPIEFPPKLRQAELRAAGQAGQD